MGSDVPKHQSVAAAQPCAPKPRLSLVHTTAELELTGSWFCGYCGVGPKAGAAVTPATRVCGSCGRGLLLEARSDASPRRDEAFLVVDSGLTVQAVSRCAEKLLAVREEDVAELPVGDLLVAAEPEAPIEERLPSVLAHAIADGERVMTVCVRPRDTFGVRFPARISVCGPPRAALIVLRRGGPQQPRLRLVNRASNGIAFRDR
jgi:hypothetical protein